MNLEAIMYSVKNIVSMKTSNININLDDILFENGVDSVSIIEIIVEIEEIYDIEFDSSKLNYQLFRTIRTISQEIDRMVNKS